jgi:inner membrane protein
MSGSFIESLGPWAWVVLGVILIGIEMFMPGLFLIWIGLAALATGALDGLLDLSWQTSALIFAALSVLFVFVGRALIGGRESTEGPGAMLNRRGDALIGRIFVLTLPIADGVGKVKVDDSYWRVTGPDAAMGDSVKVVRIDGATLVVERA